MFLAAADVGGIQANDNLSGGHSFRQSRHRIERSPHRLQDRFEKLLFLGSSCTTREAFSIIGCLALCWQDHWSRPTNGMRSPKSLAFKLCQAYRRQHGFRPCQQICLGRATTSITRTVMSLRLCCDAFTWQRFLGSLASRFTELGKPRREFVYIEDAADACVFLMKSYSDGALERI